MSIRGLVNIASLDVVDYSMYRGFLYMVRFCLVSLTIYSLQIPGSIVTPIAGTHLFLKPVIGVYIFGISGVNASLSAYPGNSRLAK